VDVTEHNSGKVLLSSERVSEPGVEDGAVDKAMTENWDAVEVSAPSDRGTSSPCMNERESGIELIVGVPATTDGRGPSNPWS
jgi:hypothetical protein